MAGKTYEIAFNLAAKIGSSFNSAFSGASQKLSALQTNIKAARASMRELEMQQKKGVISTLEYAASYEKLTAQLYKAEQLQGKLAKAQALQNRVGTVGDKARNIAGAAAAAGAGLTVPAAAAISFDTEMAYVAKQVDGARDELGNLTEIGRQAKVDIMTMSRDLMIMPNEVAKAYAFAARAGVKGAENLRKMTELGVMMGTAFELPSAQLSTDMAKIGNALGYNLETAEGIAKLEALADKINYVDDQTIAQGQDLIDWMTRSAGIVKGLAPTMTEYFELGLGAGFLSMGVKAEQAETATRNMLAKFAAAPTETKDFQASLELLGLSAEQLQQNMIKDAGGAIMDFFERLKKMDEATRYNIMAEVFGKEHIGTLSRLVSGTDKFVEAIKLANSEAAKGSVRKEIEILSKTSTRHLEGAQATLARTLGALGEGLLPQINEKAQGLARLAEAVGVFAREHPTMTSAVMTGATGLTVFALAVSATTWVLARAVSPLIAFGRWMFMARMTTDGAVLSSRAAVIATRAWAAAQWLLNASLMGFPATWILIGIAALIAAGWALYRNWDKVIAWFQEKFGWLEEKWNSLKNLIGAGINVPVSMPAAGGIGDIPIPGHAAGGIFNVPHLAWFAEGGTPEAAIPIDGSERSRNIWARAGEMLGVSAAGGTINATFAPVINMGGGADANEVRLVLADAREKFRRMLMDLQMEARRISFA